MTEEEIKDLALKFQSGLIESGYQINQKLQQENEQLKKKLDKAIELLIEYHMPCDIDEFWNKNIDYCMDNCSVDEEVYKKCWLRYIEQELKEE